MEERKAFTIEEGIKIQKEQVRRWKLILKPSVLKQLLAVLAERNADPKMKSGYDVTRGQMIDEIVWNLGYNIFKTK